MIIKEHLKKEFYQAILNKNSEYEGILYVGVKTTGVFCRPTCSARKPKFQHCEFFQTPKQALLAAFRPCKRCQPLSHPNQVSKLIQKLVKAIEENPEKKWKGADFKKIGLDESTARRQFKKRFSMTFVEYARARRIGLAMKQIRAGHSIIDTQLSSGYDSSSGFRDAFSKIMGTAPSRAKQNKIFKAAWLDTKLGPMIAIADEKELHLLEFIDRRGLEKEVENLRIKLKAIIIPGLAPPIEMVEKELTLYFEGKLKNFKTPLFFQGSDFQKKVWENLKKIPHGETISYLNLAKKIGNDMAFRAVARANGANQIAILVPCHRVINENGELGGYGGGIARKQWLIEHEMRSLRNKKNGA